MNCFANNPLGLQEKEFREELKKGFVGNNYLKFSGQKKLKALGFVFQQTKKHLHIVYLSDGYCVKFTVSSTPSESRGRYRQVSDIMKNLKAVH